MSQTNQNSDTLVGYVNQPQVSINFSLTEQELNDLAKFLVANKKDPSKPSRVYCTLRSGVSKAGNPYSLISVYDANAKNGNTHKAVATPTAEGDDLPF